MKCPLRVDSQGNALDCYKDECAWWIINAEIEGSKSTGACAVLGVAVNGIFVTIGGDEEEDYN
ncbi:MAG: hypothetical protein ACQESO_04515 [Bacillota bacterium]